MTLVAKMRRRLAAERGFTLIELMVAGVVGIVIIGAAFGLLDAVVRTFGTSGDRVDVSQRGRLAIDTITQKLRSQVCGGSPPNSYTPAVVSATRDRVVFWSDPREVVPNTSPPQYRPKRLRGIELSGSTIRELEFPDPGTDPTATPTPRDLVTDVAANNNGGLFRYYAYNPAASNQTASPEPPLFVELPTPLTATDLRRVVRITVAYTAYPRRSNASDPSAADFNGDFVSRTAASPYEFTAPPTDPAVVEPRCR